MAMIEIIKIIKIIIIKYKENQYSYLDSFKKMFYPMP